MAALSDNLRGALFMSASMAGFIVNDALMKSFAGELPLYQAIFLRGCLATALIAMLATARGAFRLELVSRRDGALIGLRSFAEIAATLCYLTALFHLPLANASAILQLMPLTVTLAAALFLSEPVGWRRGAAIGAGFLGVMLVIRPGADGFNVYALVACAAVCFATLRDLTTRRLDKRTPTLLVSLATSCVVTVVAGALALSDAWRPVAPDQLARLAAAAAALFIGYMFGVMAMRVGEISVVSPFRYTSMIWAIAIGVVAFGEVPDAFTLWGAAIIIAAGIYTFYRERRATRTRPAASASVTPRGP